MEKLSLQEESLSLAFAEVQSVLDHIEQCVGHHADSEFMGMHAELACQVQQGVEEHDEGVLSLEPVEEVDVEVEMRCAETLQQLCQTKAKLTQLSTVISSRAKIADLNNMSACTLTTKAKGTQLSTVPAKCTVSGEGAKTAMLNSVFEASLTTTKCKCKVDCHLKSLSNGSIIKCHVDQTGDRNYSIQYTPTVRGRCELTVSVDGQQVADSPLPHVCLLPCCSTRQSCQFVVWYVCAYWYHYQLCGRGGGK